MDDPFRSVARRFASNRMQGLSGHVTTETAPQLAAVAAGLRQAELTRIPVPPPSALMPGMTVDDAYRIQGLNLQARFAAGERPVGHKVGLTSKAMQMQLGVDQPDFGVITDQMVIPNGGTIDVGGLVAPRLEAEFAFQIARDVAPSPSLDELRSAIGGVAVAIEIIDSRVADWKITLVDTVADNASSARIVCGTFLPATSELLAALPGLSISLSQDGAERTSGLGSAVLGDPVVALHWLATAIGAFDDGFAEGDIVLAGAVAAALPLVGDATWAVAADGFDPAIVYSLPSAM
jgi:2-keto-4-pentenoate hydratase